MKFPCSLLRSLFISIFPVMALIGLGYSARQFYIQGFSLHILGLALVSGVIVSFFAGLFIKPVARTDANLKSFSIGITVAMLCSLLALYREHLNIAILSSSIGLAVCWLLYIKWYSVFSDRTSSVLKIGNQLSAFKLENFKKEAISSNTFLGNPSIFLFYRGNWCPLCMAQINEIAAAYKALEELKVNTILISPQPHKNAQKLAEKFNLNFHFLVDTKNKLAKQLGIFAKYGTPAGFQLLGYDTDTVQPTVVITNKNGEIIYADLTDNYRIRPEPEEFLNLIKTTMG